MTEAKRTPATDTGARRLEIDVTTGDLKIVFPYDPDLLPVVRSLIGRRWHPDGRYWTVPRDHLRAAAETLIEYGFQLSDEVRAQVGDPAAGSRDAGVGNSSGPSAGAAERSAAPSSSGVAEAPKRGRGLVPDLPLRFDDSRDRSDSESPTEKPKTLTVGRLNEWVRAKLLAAFPASLWITGEVLGFDRNAHKKHIYFQLAEKVDGDDRPRAVVGAVMFDRERRLIQRRLKEATSPFTVSDGIEIRVRAKVDLYPVTGSYQIVIDEIDPEHTLGSIAKRRERILAEVASRGLRDENRAAPFPRPCLRLALITSLESDAYNDLVNELQSSGFPFRVDIFDAHVQGQFVERDLVRGLGCFAARAEHYDALAIVRGGGSQTDLMGFDSLPIALAVAQHPLKVLVGIGHHRDRTVLDEIAHSEKTPTAIGKRLVALAQAELDALNAARELLVTQSSTRLATARAELSSRAQLYARTSQLRLMQARSRLTELAHGLDVRLGTALERERGRLDSRTARLVEVTRRDCESKREALGRLRARLPELAGRGLADQRDRLLTLASRVRGADPARLLERGFAWLMTASGDSIKSIDGVESGQVLRARLNDGEIRAIVDEVTSSRDSPREDD